MATLRGILDTGRPELGNLSYIYPGRIGSGIVVELSDNLLVYRFSNGLTWRFTGVGLADDSAPGGGTVTSWTEISSTGLTSNEYGGFSVGGDELYDAIDFMLISGTGLSRARVFQLMTYGDDLISAGDRNEYVDAFTGHDVVTGGAGSDILLGGDGNDHLYGQSASGGEDGVDSISGGVGGDYVQGNAGNDTLSGGPGSDRIAGGADNDDIDAGEGNDSVNGNKGNDTIRGDTGNDFLQGGQGNDSLSGGVGNDVLSGNLGQDTLNGGEGIDHFPFDGMVSPVSAPDQINAFGNGTDKIDLGFQVRALLLGENQTDAAVALQRAQQLADANPGNGEAVVMVVGDTAYLYYAANGGGTLDSAIRIAVSPDAFSLVDFL